MISFLLLLAGLYLLVNCLLVLAFLPGLLARWREPVFRFPILCIESDDWGAGPLDQAAALSRLSAMLQRVRDARGRPALMTLGVILEVPDGPRIAEAQATDYHALDLADSRFDGVRDAMRAGVNAGVFACQLHGQSHYWPPALLAAAQTDGAVRQWLTAAEPAATESLPSALQSRWVDASTLPSRPLSGETVARTIADEVAGYRRVLGEAPRVAVATTFVWNEAVETAWAHAGIEVVVTPGRRATCRDANGDPGCVDRVMLTGARSAAGPLYLVRDVYFEPALGQAPQRLADGLAARARQGRPCLVETHRFNFLDACEASVAALEAALAAALAAWPETRFASPLEIAHAIARRDPAWIETRVRPRLAAWSARLDEIPRFRRLARLTGLAWPLSRIGGRA